MKPAQREKLHAACDLIGQRRREGVEPAKIISELVFGHGGRFDRRHDGYRLSIAGVTSTCTWSSDHGLLNNWTKTATVRLMSLNL